MKKVLSFVVLTCVVSWLCAGIAYVLGLKIHTPAYIIFGVLYMYFPAICSLILQKYWYKESIKKHLLISFHFNKWFLIALLTPLVISCFTIIISMFTPEVQLASSPTEGFLSKYDSVLSIEMIEEVKISLSQFTELHFFVFNIILALTSGCTINAIAAFGEELGWRGYMLRHLNNYSFIKASFFIGLIWGIWHFPLILMGHNYPEDPVKGVFFMIVFCILLSPVFTYLTIKSKSVICAAIFHGSINSFAAILYYYLIGSDFRTGLLGIPGFISIAIVTLLFYLYDRFISKEKIFSNKLNI